MKNSLIRSFGKAVAGVALLAGITTGVVASTAAPAQAGVVVSVGFGGGYAPAPAYHWYRWHDGYGWHRQWVRAGWAPPVAYAPAPVFYGRPVYGRPVYGHAFAGPRYVDVHREWHGDWHGDRDHR
jgi:hypothetical protein